MPKKKEEVLTKEEEKIIDQTVKLEQRDQQEPKIGVVLSGGIDSAVTLCKVKEVSKGKDIQAILLADDSSSSKAVKDLLDNQGITSSSKTMSGSTKGDKKEVLQYCFENNISPLYFPTNYEESLINSRANDMLEWKQISSEMNDYAVVIAEPLRVTNKSVIITWAKDYGVLDKTIKPNNLDKIREDAFIEANRHIHSEKDKIVDPHVTKEEETS